MSRITARSATTTFSLTARRSRGISQFEDHVFLSSHVVCHQFVRLGRYAMVGGKSKIVQDVLPFFITNGNPPRVRGLNAVGLRRADFAAAARNELKRAYQLLFRKGLPVGDALAELERVDDEHMRHLVSFIRNSKRGFTSADRRGRVDTAEAVTQK